MDLVEPNHMAIEQFTALLHQQACIGNICCHAHVSTQGLPEEVEDAFDVIAAHAWEATGFRFTYGQFILKV